MARRSMVERCEAVVGELEPGGALGFEELDGRPGVRAVVWSKDGQRRLAFAIGGNRSKAAHALLQKLRAARELAAG